MRGGGAHLQILTSRRVTLENVKKWNGDGSKSAVVKRDFTVTWKYAPTFRPMKNMSIMSKVTSIVDYSKTIALYAENVSLSPQIYNLLEENMILVRSKMQ